MFSTIGYWICVPFAWLVRLFYTLTRSYGMAVILFTVVLKLILLPFQMKSKKSMIRMSRMSGKMQEIQKKYANNQQKMNEEIQRLYEEEGVNPMSGCLWSFLPLPILIALYAIIRDPVTRFMMLSMETLEEIIQRLTAAGADMSSIVRMQDGAAVVASNGFTQLIPFGQINLVRLVTEEYPQVVSDINGWINVSFRSFGLDLASTPSSQISSFTFTWGCIGLILIPVVTGLSQFLMSLITMKQQPQQDPNAAATSRSMMFFMPLFSVWISFSMPAAMGLYWIAQSGLSAVQEFIMGRFFNKKFEEEENARAAAREADRKRRIEQGREQQAQRKNQPEHKPTLKEKKKAAQSAKANKAARQSTNEAGRVGERPYARGRSYRADRYDV